MHNDHRDELVKAKLYAEEPARFVWVDQKTVVWKSTGTIHLLVRMDGRWQCDCFYDMQSHLPCGHVRGLETLLTESTTGLDSQIELVPRCDLRPAYCV